MLLKVHLFSRNDINPLNVSAVNYVISPHACCRPLLLMAKKVGLLFGVVSWLKPLPSVRLASGKDMGRNIQGHKKNTLKLEGN